jgi:uncharacterized protein (TIGR03118 family)
MNNQILLGRRAACVLCLAALTAVQGLPAASTNSYVVHNLVADVPGVADHVDPFLIDPWGISFSATSPFWISNRGTGTSTLYNGIGQLAPITSPLVVVVPRPASATGPGHSTPTGQVQNSAGAFAIGGKNPSFIFCTEDGTLSGYISTNTPPGTLAVDNSAAGAVYKGMALAVNGATPYLYVANFGGGTVDVYDTNYKKTTLSGAFTDSAIPAGFAPFNVANIAGKLYVTYAKQNAAKNHDTAGAGNGYVDIFDLNGNLLQKFAATGTLNSPWGVAVAPSSFGAFAGNVLVGNFGDGTINAFDATSGAFQGQLQDATGKPIAIPGLWGIAFGNGGQDFDSTILYFTAGPGGESHGLFGSVQTSASLAAPAVTSASLVNAASFAATTQANGAVAPGSMAALFGANLSTVVQTAITTPIPTSLGDTTSVSIGGFNAPLFFASNKQINLQVPFEVGAGTANIIVTRGGQVSATQAVTIAPASPGIFTTGQAGTGQGAIVNTNFVLVNASAPATALDIVQVFCTGLGATTPSVPTGSVTPSANLTEPVVANATVTASVGGVPALVKFAGLASGYVGLYQVNVQIPTGVTVGSSVPLILTVNGINSNTATLAVK